MATKANLQEDSAVGKYLAELSGKDVLVKLDWDQWMKIQAPYPEVAYTKKEVTTRFERNGYDWVMHGSVYTPKTEIDSSIAFFVMHGSGDNENNMDIAPDGRPGLA